MMDTAPEDHALTLFSGNGITTPLDARAQRIRDLVTVTRGCIIEIGRELIAAKAEVRHGEWLQWLDREFGWSIETARKFMQVAEAFPEIPTRLEFDASALYALSSSDVPQEARDAAITQAKAGEHVTKAHAEALIADALAGEQARFDAAIAQIRADRYLPPARR
jgi:hypothetical protein